MFRVGLGHDTHRLGEGTFIMLGGVRIEHARSLVGHSDADVLLHAVADALLGASGLGDIGDFFPDSAVENRGRDSAEMLDILWKRIRRLGWNLVNLDLIVFAEQPKLSPYKERIKRRLGEILESDASRIGLKAKTGERVGPIGREEAIAVECVVLLEKPS